MTTALQAYIIFLVLQDHMFVEVRETIKYNLNDMYLHSRCLGDPDCHDPITKLTSRKINNEDSICRRFSRKKDVVRN